MVTSQDVKESLPDTFVQRVEVDQPSAFDDAARKAKLWVKSRHLKAGLGSPNYQNDLVREATLERAKYEIYALRETEDVAQDKKENAAELLEPVVGEAGDSDNMGAPGSSVLSSEKPAFLDGFEGRQEPDGRVP